MKTQKIIIPAIISLMLISIFSFLYSCNKQNDDVNLHSSGSYEEGNIIKTKSNIIKTTGVFSDRICDSIGVIHNQSLVYAFNKIKDEKLFVNLTDSAEVISIMSQLTSEYLNSYFAYIPYYYAQGDINSILDYVFNNPSFMNDYSSVFQEKMVILLNEYDSARNLNEYKDFATAFLVNNLSKIPEEEQFAFKAAIIVSYNSWEYWELFLDDWINEYRIQNGLPPLSFRFDKRACGKADIEGVVGGAIGGALTGGLVGAALGAAFGGPIASGVNALFQAFW